VDVDALVASQTRPASRAKPGAPYAAGAGVLAGEDDADLDALLSQPSPSQQSTQEYAPWAPKAPPAAAAVPACSSSSNAPGPPVQPQAAPQRQPAHPPRGRAPQQQRQASAWDYPVAQQQQPGSVVQPAASETVDLSQDGPSEAWRAPAAAPAAPQRLRRITKRGAAQPPVIELE
jgi:hypothetical protein